MQKAIELARKISDNLDSVWIDEVKEVNLHKIFEPVFKLNLSLTDLNTIVCYIIYAYDNDSTWLNLNRDRIENKKEILKGLNADLNRATYSDLLNNENEIILDVITNYLIGQTTWKWQQIITQIEYHAKMMRFVNQKTEEEKTVDKMNKEGEVKTLTTDYDIDTITKVNKEKGILLEQALKARREADTLLAEIKKEFVQLDNLTQGEFGFEVTEEKNINPESWREFIKRRNYLKGRNG